MEDKRGTDDLHLMTRKDNKITTVTVTQKTSG